MFLGEDYKKTREAEEEAERKPKANRWFQLRFNLSMVHQLGSMGDLPKLFALEESALFPDQFQLSVVVF